MTDTDTRPARLRPRLVRRLFLCVVLSVVSSYTTIAIVFTQPPGGGNTAGKYYDAKHGIWWLAEDSAGYQRTSEYFFKDEIDSLAAVKRGVDGARVTVHHFYMWPRYNTPEHRALPVGVLSKVISKRGSDPQVRPLQTVSCGFPLRFATCIRWSTPAGSPMDIAGGIQITPPWRTSTGAYIVPLQPQWSLLITNIIIHTAAWFMLLSIPCVLRRRRRLRRGLCTSCGYELVGARGPQCPECGHAAS